MPKKQKSYIEFLVDVSGIPKRDASGNYQKVIIASTSFNMFNLDDVMDAFKGQFFNYWEKKGHQLSAHKLEEIIDFLNQENVRMTTIHFDIPDWEKYKTEYQNEANLEEKIMGILYFYVLKKIAWKEFIYRVLVDNDSTFNIRQSIIVCQRLARAHNYDFNISFGYRDINPELRFPDWVASARRKIDPSNFAKYKYFIILKNQLPPYYLIKIFKRVRL